MLPALLLTLLTFQRPPATLPAAPSPTRLQVFLDCGDCFASYLRDETSFVDFVRDRSQADVHVIITNVGTGSGGREYVLAFTREGRRAGSNHSLKAITGTGDPEEIRRQQVVTTFRIGLLQYLAADGAPPQLEVNVELAPATAGEAAARNDPWNSWVFSLRGSASANGEESNKEREARGSFSADRITPDWKLTFGMEFDDETEANASRIRDQISLRGRGVTPEEILLRCASCRATTSMDSHSASPTPSARSSAAS